MVKTGALTGEGLGSIHGQGAVWCGQKKKVTPVCRFFHRNEVFVVLNMLFNKDLRVHSLSGPVCWELGLQRGANRQDSAVMPL